jgi:hypothetical protein
MLSCSRPLLFRMLEIVFCEACKTQNEIPLYLHLDSLAAGIEPCRVSRTVNRSPGLCCGCGNEIHQCPFSCCGNEIPVSGFQRRRMLHRAKGHDPLENAGRDMRLPERMSVCCTSLFCELAWRSYLRVRFRWIRFSFLFFSEGLRIWI